MIPSQLYHIFITNFPDMTEQVVSYQQPNNNVKQLKLMFTSGRHGLFTYVQKDHYILEVYPK